MGSLSRSTPAVRAPQGPLGEFPRWRARTDRVFYRAHRAAVGPWWFSSSGAGRFDLPPPHGTCYLATDALTALREAAGSRLTALGTIDVAFATERCVSALRLPTGRWLADSCHRSAALFGLTRELCTITPYDVPHQWAAAFHADGFAGVRYESRFTTQSRPNSAAVFGATGEASWPVDPAPVSLAVLARGHGLMASAPRARSLRFVPPPT